MSLVSSAVVSSNMVYLQLGLVVLLAPSELKQRPVDKLIADLGSPVVETRIRAARSLSAAGRSAANAVPALGSALQDDSEDVRAYAAIALKELGPDAQPAAGALISAWQVEKNPATGMIMGEAIVRIGRPVVPQIMAIVADNTPSAEVRGCAISL